MASSGAIVLRQFRYMLGFSRCWQHCCSIAAASHFSPSRGAPPIISRELFLHCSALQTKHSSATIAIAPTVTPTPIPAFAPVESSSPVATLGVGVAVKGAGTPLVGVDV